LNRFSSLSLFDSAIFQPCSFEPGICDGAVPSVQGRAALARSIHLSSLSLPSRHRQQAQVTLDPEAERWIMIHFRRTRFARIQGRWSV
jgi:hypothetical protein